MVAEITLFDTTLRDGEQAPMNAMSVETKVDLFNRIAMSGIDRIEAGFPAASPIDYEAVSQILQQPTNASLSLFARATRGDIDCCLELAGNRRDLQIQILVTGSEIHLEHKRQITLEEAIEETREAVEYAANHNIEVSLAVEDASRGSYSMLEKVIKTGVDAGATTVVVTDTVGAALPSQFGAMVAAAREWVGAETSLSVHCHNDLGLAVANSIAGIAAGANECQGTLCGIGERAGNAALEEIVAILLTKEDEFARRCNVDPIALLAACNALSEAIDFDLQRNKPILGRWVNATAAGLHQSGMLKHPDTYEPFDPALFGREREFLITRHSGSAAVRDMLKRHVGNGPDEVEPSYLLSRMGLEGKSFSSTQGEEFRSFVASCQAGAK
ncbi:hypothetical protein [uncultured Erythrobacter sp.]|uniref:LeuA family protein n=1 Tax=uncultured Erythrobacter sp. TaxID=263913 RepID=UPI002625D491|nr:hypothetical protein [uncultured Erythrobacter sp.]